MQHLEVSSAVRHIYMSLGGKGLSVIVIKYFIYGIVQCVSKRIWHLSNCFPMMEST
jgi:hypothetical protein